MLGAFASTRESLLAQPAALAIGAGLVVGAITGTAVVATGILGNPPTPQVALVSCPGSDAIVARVDSGSQVLVTARSADGAWLRLYLGPAGIEDGWAPTTDLRFTASPDALPIHDCSSSVAVASTGPAITQLASDAPSPEVTFVATVGPTTSLAPGETVLPTPVPTPTPKPGPTPKPTATPKPGPTPHATLAPTPLPPPPTIPPPTPTPTPTPPPPPPPPPTPTPFVDHTPPEIDTLTTTGDYYFNNDEGQFTYNVSRPSSGCLQPHSAVITATISDPDDSVTSATLLYWKPHAGIFDPATQVSMNKVGVTSWQATIAVQDSWTTGVISYAVHAADAHGNVSGDQYYSAAYVLAVDACIL